jgi:hypothetical protein
MVLAAMGDERTEGQLATVLCSYEFGTPASRVMHLIELGYQVQFGPSSLEKLQAHLDRGLFPIVFVRADLLPWADFGGFHAMVLIEITPTDVALLDPGLIPALPGSPRMASCSPGKSSIAWQRSST